MNMFNEDDFVKRDLSKGDIFSFDDFSKSSFDVAKVILSWNTVNNEPDLDLAAILLGPNGKLTRREDLIYFNSTRRWKTSKPLEDEDFKPLEGRVSSYDEDGKDFINYDDWKENTLPLSLDDSVIGSWDDRGDGDDDGPSEERIHVSFKKTNTHDYRKIAIIAAIAMDQIERFKFRDVFNPVVKVLDAQDDKVLAEYRLNNSYPDCDGLCVGFLQYNDETHSWEFLADEKSYNGGLLKIANSFTR